jgi:hypothetical protein
VATLHIFAKIYMLLKKHQKEASKKADAFPKKTSSAVDVEDAFLKNKTNQA